MGRMSRFLRLGAFLSVLFFATNVFAAGYTCPSYKRYTSCNEGYYLSSEKAGNSCLACPDGYTCSGGTSQPEKAAVANVSIVLNKNGGSGTCAGASGTNKGEVTCTPGNTCTLPSWNSSTCSITNGNKIFKGWSTSSSATNGVTSITTPNASVTYYAVWVTPTCSATNGTCAITTPSNNAPRAKITCKAGYSQNGGTNTTTSFTVTGSAGATSVSGTCKIRKEITVTFKSGDTVLGTQACLPGVAQPLKDITHWPAPVSSEYGWSLVGLATSVNSTTVAYTNGAEATFEKDTTLYGVWIRPAQFTYIENGEVKRSNQTQYYYNVSTTSAEVTSLTLPGLISSGYGWSPKGWHDEYGNILTYVEKTSLALSPESHSELSAWYQRTVWLVYNGNGSTGGSTASASKTQSYFARFGTSEISSGGFVLAPNGFTRTGYTFSKWAAGSTSGTQYSVNEGFAFPNTAWDSSDSYNMYAIWTLNTYTCAAGKYLNGATCTTCDAGYSCPGGTWTYNGGVQGRTACGGNTKYSSSGAASCSTVSSGYYTTGGTSTTRTGQSQCTGATYCSSGVKYDCPSGYTANTSNGKTAASQCQISCAAGTRVDSQGGACKIPSGNWYTTATQLVNYGNVSTVNYCMAGFSSSSTVATGHDEKTDCVQSVAGGKYIPATQIQARYVKVTTAGSTANAGSHVVEIQAFKTADGTGTNFLYGLGGVSGSNLKAATDGSWAIGNYASGTMIWDMGTVQMLGSIKFALYTDGRVYHDVTVSVSTDNSNWTTVLGPVEVATSATSTAVGDLIVLSAVPESCAAGTYKASTSVALGKTSSCGACANWTYSGAGAASCTSCPTVESGYAKLDSTSTGWTTYTKCVEIASAAPSNCSAGKLQKIPTASGASTWASATVNSSNPLSASAGYYVNGTQCTACGGNNYYCEGGTTARKTVSTGYYTTGGTTTTRTGQSQCTGTTYCSSGVQNNCPSGYTYNTSAGKTAASSCTMLVPAAHYLVANASSATACGTGTWNPSHERAYGASSGCNSCPSGYDDGAAASAESGCKISVAGGKYIGTAKSATLSTCAGGTYKAAHTVAYGSTSSCATCSAGYYCPEGASSQTACGSNNKYSSTGAASCSTVSSGYYSTGGTATTRTGQTKCEAGNYCSSGVKTACGGGKWSSAGATSCSSITAGCYGTSAGSACPAVCGDAQYSNAGAASCSGCPTDYKNSGTEAASHAGSASCIITVSGGYYIGTAGDNSSNWDKCAGGTYKAQHTVAYGSTSSCATCSAGYYCPAGAGSQTACGSNAKYSGSGAAACSDVSSGYYTTGGTSTTRTGQTKCEAGNYCSGGVKTACSTLASGFYPNSAAGSDAAADCYTNVLRGKYVASVNATGATSCAAGTFKGSHQVNYGSKSSCDACALGSYSAAGASACTACQGGKTTSGTGKSSCDATCENNNSYDSTWATATWSDNAVANLCQIATCAGGSRYTSVNGAAAGTLPSGYTQLAYLESTGTQAIDTKTVLQTDNVEFEWTAVDKSTASYTTLFGSETSSNPKYTGILHGSNTSRTLYYGSIPGKGVGYSAGAELARWKLLLTDMVRLYKNDVMVSSELEASSLQKSLPIAVFASNLRGSMGQFSSVQMYSFKIWDGGKLVLNLIPAMRDSDGVLGMYDTVNNRFLVNAGSGKFVAGPIILKSQNTCTQCAAGTYSAGGTATSCGTCANWTYSSAGAASCSACLSVPDAVGGVAWTKASGTGWTSYSNCVVSQTPANCASGSVKRTQSSATAWGGTTLVSALKSKAGYYASATATSCTICPAGSYCPASATSATACAIGSYTNATGKSACTECSAGKTTTGTGKTSCDASCSNATGAHTWATPSWSANSVTNLCTVSKCNANTYYTATTGNGYKNTCTACGSNSSTSAGNTSTTCTCTTGYTSTGGVSGATTSTSGCSLISDIACAIGQYLPASSTSCLACTAGYYCPSSAKTYSYSSSIQGRKECSAGTYQPDTGKTSCTPASKGYYVSGTAKTAQTACTGATYAANTGQSSCTACPTATNNASKATSYSYWNNGGTADHTTVTGCYVHYSNDTVDNGSASLYYCYADTDAATTGEYGVDGTSKGCWVYWDKLKCDGGYYNKNYSTSSNYDFTNKTIAKLKANACQNVGAGYWSANDALTRTACASPLTTIGYGTAANEAEDCGRKLHAGANVIYLRSAARTSPSLRVKVGNTTFYGALSTSLSSPVKVKNGSTTYSVVNDWQ